MGNFYETISTNTQKFVNQQEVFWVASAPLSSEGRVNVSPKGTTLVVKENDETYQEYKVFWVLSENKVAYLDFFGSGVETLSHLRESNNGRITLQFNAFEGSPRIIRLFGHGKAYDVDSPEFLEVLPPDLKNHVDKLGLARSLIIIDVNLVGQSCGYGVPMMNFSKHRTNFVQSLERKTKLLKEGTFIDSYRKTCGKSVDGISPYPHLEYMTSSLIPFPIVNRSLYLAAGCFALGVITSRLFSMAL